MKDNDIKKIIEIQKQIAQIIPKEKDELFKFSINWNVAIKNDILDSKLKPWLNKKMKEFLSEEEPQMMNYILKLVASKSNPYEIIENIRVVFEEDTEVKNSLIKGFCDKDVEVINL